MISWITPVSYQLRANARASDQLRATRAQRIQSTAETSDPHLIRSSLPPSDWNTRTLAVCFCKAGDCCGLDQMHVPFSKRVTGSTTTCICS